MLLLIMATLALPVSICCGTESPEFSGKWQPSEAERLLLDLDLDGPATSFDLLGDQEGASIIFRVRDTKTKEKVAVVKLNSRHSQASAEVFAWRMAYYLGFPEIVVPAVPVRLKGGALLKLRQLFMGLDYDDPAKEKIRLEIVANLNEASAGNLIFSGVLKPWLKCFMFTEELGTLENLAKSPVAEWLKYDGFPPDAGDFTLRQRTRLYEPQGIHLGTINKKQLARDLSNIMVLDALMGQSDRFAGANLHFWNKGGQRTERPQERKNPVWDLGRVRLLALDNGLAFRGRNGNGLLDLQGLVEAGSRVELFDPTTVAKLRSLGKVILQTTDNPDQDQEKAHAVWKYFGLEHKQYSLAQYYLQGTLDYLSALETAHNHAIYLAP